MACTVLSVKASNGKDSQLFQELLNKHDMEKAVRYYLSAHSMEGAYSEQTTDANGELKADYVTDIMEHGDQDDYSIANQAETRNEAQKYQPLEHKFRAEISHLEDQKGVIRNTTGKPVDYKAIYALDKQINDKRDTLRDLNENPIVSGERLKDYAEKDLVVAQGLINKKDITLSELNYLNRLISTWKDAKQTMQTEEDIAKNPALSFFADDYINLEKRAIAVGVAMTTKIVKEGLGYDVRQEKIFQMNKDINPLKAQVLDISDIDNPAIQLAHKMATLTNLRTEAEIHKHQEELSGLVNAAKKLLDSKTGWIPFLQMTKNGALTPNLVDRLTPEFYKEEGTLRGKAFDSGLVDDWRDYYSWQKDNVHILDSRVVAPEFQDRGKPITPEEAEAHRALIESKVGKKEADRLFKELRKKAETYSGYKEGALLSIEMEHNLVVSDLLKDIHDPKQEAEMRAELEKGLQQKLDNWIDTNSPYRLKDYVEGNASGIAHPQFAGQYSIRVANQSEHYDPRFDRIANNKTFSDLYDKMIDTIDQLRNYLPEEERRKIYRNGLPAVKMTMLEAFKDNPNQFAMIADIFKGSVSVQDTSTKNNSIRDSENRYHGKLRANIVADHKAAINDIVARKKIEFQEDQKRAPTAEEVSKMKEWATDDLVRRGSLDVGKMMDTFIAAATTYKYKAAIEDHLAVIANMVNNELTTNATNKAGETLLNGSNPIPQKDVKNTISSFNYFMRHWYGEGKPITAKAGLKADWLMTSRDKELRKELTNLKARVEANQELMLDPLERERQLAIVDEQLNTLGSYLAGSMVGDVLMKYMVYKSLAFNPFSAVSNVLQGVYSNLVEAAAGTNYTTKELMTAFGMVTHSMSAFYTGGYLKTDLATKIRNIMDKLNVMSEANKELFEEGVGNNVFTSGMAKSLNPMNWQQRSEYINQAPLVVAMMLHKKITIDGTEHKLFDCFDKNGDWKFGENKEWDGDSTDLTANKSRLDFVYGVKRVMKDNHGNYDSLNSPLMAKEQIHGRAMVMFRTWIFSMANYRVASPWTDYGSSDGPQEKKGIYRSLPAYYKANGGFIGTVLDGSQQLLRKLAFQGTTFENKVGPEFTMTDAANLRRTFTEITSFLVVTGAFYAMKGLLPGSDDDKDSTAKMIRNQLLNTMLKLQTDLTFFSNPMSIEALNQDLVPMFGLVKNAITVISEIIPFIEGEDKVDGGQFDGTSKIARNAGKLIPFWNQYLNAEALGRQVYGMTAVGH